MAQRPSLSLESRCLGGLCSGATDRGESVRAARRLDVLGVSQGQNISVAISN